MKRRQLMRYAQAGLITSLGAGIAARWSTPSSAQGAGSVNIRWLGHTCFMVTGSGQRVLVNPYQRIGCTAKYGSSQIATDLVLISSRLLDEGVVEGLPGQPKLLFKPGAYQTNGLTLQGIRTLHDRVQGYRFGVNVAWKWVQGGINLLHLGGIASPIQEDQRILMGRPDVLMIPVGGSDKAYTPEEARAAIATLGPKLVIPTHYLTAAADPNACDLQPLENFLAVMQGTPVRRVGSSTLFVSRANLPSAGPVIEIPRYG